MKKNRRILLIQLKSNAIKLRAKYQLPYYLVYCIRAVDNDTQVEIINELCSLTEHYLRVTGYYSRYPDINDLADEEVKKMFRVIDNKLTRLPSGKET